MNEVTELFGGYDSPLIWIADFILNTDELGHDLYVLGEMKCACIGFTSERELAHHVAKEIISCINEKISN